MSDSSPLKKNILERFRELAMSTSFSARKTVAAASFADAAKHLKQDANGILIAKECERLSKELLTRHNEMVEKHFTDALMYGYSAMYMKPSLEMKLLPFDRLEEPTSDGSRVVAEFLRRLTYKPGWTFRVIENTLCIDAHVLDALRPGRMTSVMLSETIPPDLPAKAVETFIASKILAVEEHELKEFFQVDGKQVLDPHPELGTQRRVAPAPPPARTDREALDAYRYLLRFDERRLYEDATRQLKELPLPAEDQEKKAG